MDQQAELARILDQLRGMPDLLRSAAARLGERDVRTPGPGGSFSLVEHAWHLADLEREGYGVRIRRLLDEDDPLLPDFEGDRIARERRYGEKPLEDGIESFTAARLQNLSLLEGLARTALERTGRQQGVGRVCLGDIPRLMGEHDASHRAEIESLVRAAGRSTD